jgi:hypothetical protein
VICVISIVLLTTFYILHRIVFLKQESHACFVAFDVIEEGQSGCEEKQFWQMQMQMQKKKKKKKKKKIFFSGG